MKQTSLGQIMFKKSVLSLCQARTSASMRTRRCSGKNGAFEVVANFEYWALHTSAISRESFKNSPSLLYHTQMHLDNSLGSVT